MRRALSNQGGDLFCYVKLAKFVQGDFVRFVILASSFIVLFCSFESDLEADGDPFRVGRYEKKIDWLWGKNYTVNLENRLDFFNRECRVMSMAKSVFNLK